MATVTVAYETVAMIFHGRLKRYPNNTVTNSMLMTPSNLFGKCLYTVRTMISRRDKLLNYPFQQQRYEQHRKKVQSARPAIDFRTPPTYPHVTIKPKKQQFEKERLKRIEVENVRLLQKLGDIMRTKRLENIWQAPRPNFLNREKLFETRPHSSQPKFVEIYAPSHYEAPSNKVLKSPNSKTAQRCPTCCGRPERMELIIPEKRIPWEQPKKSMSTCALRETLFIRKKCMHCGHLKKNVE